MQRLNIKRLGLLIKKDFIENISFVLKLIIIYLLIVFIFTIIQAINDIGFGKHIIETLELFYYAGLFIIGGIVAGFAFPALRKKEKAVFYLTLPVSTLERFLSYLILSLPGFFIIFSIIYFIFAFILRVFYGIFTDVDIRFSKIDFDVIIGTYIRLNALLLLGAVWFKKTPPFFTALYTGIIVLFLGLFISIVIHILDIRSIPLEYIFGSNGSWNWKASDMHPVWVLRILRFIYLYGLVLFFWFVSVIKLKEKQI